MSLDSTLLERALELSSRERAELARRLLLSLESDPFDPDAEDQWGDEIESRLVRADSG
jgi:putative addiction module component (TIGR02574 family)